MKKIILGAVISLLMLGGSDAAAMPKYEARCFATGCGAVSDDGKRAIFTFDEPLDAWFPGSSPTNMVYERVDGTTRALFEYPEGKVRGVILHAVSDDARRAIIETRSPISPDDTDGFGNDYFAVEDGVAELISWDPADPATKSSPKLSWSFAAASSDARIVYLGRWNSADACSETWVRTATELTKLPRQCQFDRFAGISNDGLSAFSIRDYKAGSGWFESWVTSLFRYRGQSETNMADPTAIPGWNGVANSTSWIDFAESPDGESMLFGSGYPYSSTDAGSDFDVYLRDETGHFTDLSGDLPGAPGAIEGDRALGLSSDGQRALLATTRQLAPEDQDQSLDGYLRTVGGGAELVTTGPADDGSNFRNPAWAMSSMGPVQAWRIDASDDLSVIAFDSYQQLVPQDTDQEADVYVRFDGQTTLASTGPAATGANLEAKLLGISNDGSRVAFTTMEPLVEVDLDDRMDVYARSTGVTALSTDEEGASASARRGKKRTVLLSAESMAPEMKLVGKPRARGRSVSMKLRCPKTEESGPCRGKVDVRLVGARNVKGFARFRIKTGQTRLVRAKLGSMVSRRQATIRIKAWDRLGNTSAISRRVRLR